MNSKSLLAAIAVCASVSVFSQSDSSSFYLQKGLDEKTKGRRMESLKQLEKAYSFNNSNKQLVSELALAYNDLRLYAKANETLHKLEQLGDHSASTYRQLMLLN